jgi:gentisate 1,2-dioxygenase
MWSEGDFFVIPSWMWVRHVTPATEKALLFSSHDIPLLKRLQLYRIEKKDDSTVG